MSLLKLIKENLVAWFRTAKDNCGLKPTSSSSAEMAIYESAFVLSLNGQELARLSGMYIPDQFWKHYAAEILTDDAELRRKMLEDETFWLQEKFVLTREADGIQFTLNDEDSLALLCLSQAKLLREDSEIALRGI